MPKNLVIVESPAKAKTIEKYLGSDYEVIASMGHLRDLPKKTIGVDIEHDFEPKYQVMTERKELVKKLKALSKKSEHVYLATDPDREGEAISWHISNILGIDSSEKCRVTFNEITKSAVTQAVSNPREIDISLVDAQQARRILDRIVGYKLSPLLWSKIRKGLSAGRVQSVTVKIICDREEEIQNFVPVEFWTIDAELMNKDKKTFISKFYGKNGKKCEISNGDEAKVILDEIKMSNILVSDIKKTTKKRYAQPPFITSTLQQDASAKLNFTSKKTMSVAQSLYEGVEIQGKGLLGLITYMRTDSLRIATEAMDSAKEYILKNIGANYYPDKPNVYKKKGANTQDAHEAIRPTDVELEPDKIKSSLNADQYKLYKLIWNRFVSSHLKPAEFAVLTIEIEARGAKNTYNFRSSAQKMLFDGYMKFYVDNTDEEEEKSKLPDLEKDEQLILSKLIDKQNFTKPLGRYTESTLIKALEEKGIGRPSTYAPTVSTVMSREYVEKEGKTLKPTSLGILVNNIMKANFSDIVNEEFTANMEDKLDDIGTAGKNWREVLKEFYTGFEKALNKAKETVEKTPETSDILCDKCGKNMIIKSGRFGKFLACPDYPECKSTKPLAKEVLTIPCPLCGNKILEKKTKGGKIFYGCEKYPECTFSSWDLPTGNSCEKCNSFMVKKKYLRGGKEYCSNVDCENAAPKPTPKAAKTDDTDNTTEKPKAKATTKSKTTAKTTKK
jgi:DNA topoisomerase-1